jgi:8-oxo-dGTP pyrophosphatase MutT (NUDIX family)
MSSTINDLSMGAVVLGFVPDTPVTWHVLLINQKTEGGGSYWGLPKGHPENAESPEETAVREVNEECGTTLATTDLVPDMWESEHYTFYGAPHGDTSQDARSRVRIDKIVHYGLALVPGPTLPALTIQAAEIHEAGWFPLNQALKRLRHDGQRRVLRNLLRKYFVSVQQHAAKVLQAPVWPLLFGE